MKALAVEANTSSAWTLLGATGALAGLLILSFYSVAAGWALSYVLMDFKILPPKPLLLVSMNFFLVLPL